MITLKTQSPLSVKPDGGHVRIPDARVWVWFGCCGFASEIEDVRETGGRKVFLQAP